MNKGKEYWTLKIEETKELFKKRPAWMGQYDNDYSSAAFIKGLIQEYKPQNLLEVGTAAGWAAYYMLDEALKYNTSANLTSVDIGEYIYYSPERKIGSALFETVPQMRQYWDLHTKTIIADYAPICEKKFDFVFIDASHLHPWASLDMIGVLTCLSKSAIIVFHDVFLNKITKTITPSDSHPSGVVSEKEKYYGPNLFYRAFEEKMTLSYDYVVPNCACINVCDLSFDKILEVLDKEWEYDILHYNSSEEFLNILTKLQKSVKSFWGEKEAEEFMSVSKKQLAEVKKTEKIYEQRNNFAADSLNLIKKGKKQFFGGQAGFYSSRWKMIKLIKQIYLVLLI